MTNGFYFDWFLSDVSSIASIDFFFTSISPSIYIPFFPHHEFINCCPSKVSFTLNYRKKHIIHCLGLQSLPSFYFIWTFTFWIHILISLGNTINKLGWNYDKPNKIPLNLALKLLAMFLLSLQRASHSHSSLNHYLSGIFTI